MNDSLLYALCMMDAMPCNWNMDFLALQFARLRPDVYGEIKTTWHLLLRHGYIERVKGCWDRFRISQKGKEFILTAVPVAVCA